MPNGFDIGTLGGKFSQVEFIGSGSFGNVYKAYDLKRGHFCALKVENIYSGHDQLAHEYKVYRKLKNKEGFLEAYDYFAHGVYRCLTLKLVGPSLEQKFRAYDLKTTLNIAIQLIKRLRTLHNAGYVHRDVKPDNVAWGLNAESSTLYLFDLGLAQKLTESSRHKPATKKLIGTARYASLNSHMGKDLTRRDDMESLAYCLIFLLKGKLPWQGLKSDNARSKYDKVFSSKRKHLSEKLCEGLEPEFLEFLKHARSLRFSATPNYAKMISMFNDLLAREQAKQIKKTQNQNKVTKKKKKNKKNKVLPSAALQQISKNNNCPTPAQPTLEKKQVKSYFLF